MITFAFFLIQFLMKDMLEMFTGITKEYHSMDDATSIRMLKDSFKFFFEIMFCINVHVFNLLQWSSKILTSLPYIITLYM